MARAYAKGDEAPSAEDAVESYVGAFLDFLGHDQNFLRLIQREALGDGSRVAEFFGRSVDEGLAAVGPAAAKAGISPERLVLDLTALCWYPFAHEHTLLPALGMKARDPAFLDEQKRHLGDLVRAMTRTGRERPSRR
jgi:TetR/AcrR family transcriptional regulator